MNLPHRHAHRDTHRHAHRLLVCCLLLVAACAAQTDVPIGGADAGPIGPKADADPGAADAGPDTTSVDAGQLGCSKPAMTVFLNGQGGTFTAGSRDDASANRSVVLFQSAGLAAYPYDATKWQQVVACARRAVAGYNIDIVETDPGASDHMEIVVTGDGPDKVGMTPSVRAVTASTNCQPSKRGVAFVFVPVIGDDEAYQCEVIAGQLGHMMGLDSTVQCEDFMSWSTGCGTQTFRDEALQCGESEPRTCSCGGATQNSHQTLLQIAGAACD